MKKHESKDSKQLDLSLGRKAQRAYIEGLEAKKFDYGIVLANAFVKGMRDIGYKSTGYALNELNDNAIQAGARNIHVAFGYDPANKAQKKPDMVAVIDDGHGMEPLMIRASVIWGGTHRHDDRTGFGRYGYGLPSACVSIGRRYSIFSKVEEGDWHKVTIDLDEIEQLFETSNGPVHAEAPKQVNPPAWVLAYMKTHFKQFRAGTVVLIETIDRLDHWTTQGLRTDLLQEFGITYRNFLSEVSMAVDGVAVEPTDPLFLTPGFRYYDIDEDRAEGLPPLEIEVKDPETKESKGVIKVCYSYMPTTFLRTPEFKLRPRAKGKNKHNARFKIRKENNGIVVLRAGRQIDVVNAKCPWTTFQNNDRHAGVELDFTPTLDEEFGLTTLKQTVMIRPRIWDVLEQNGVLDAINQMRQRFQIAEITCLAESSAGDGKRPSEIAVEKAARLHPTAALGHHVELSAKREKKLESAARKIAAQLSLPFEAARSVLVEQAKAQPFKVQIEDAPGAPFYRVDLVGMRAELHINKAHRFFRALYAAPTTAPYSRHALEALLFTLGLIEVYAQPELNRQLSALRAQWSNNAERALKELHDDENATDELASARAMTEQESMTASSPS